MTTTAPTLDLTSPVSEWILDTPARARVFERYGIDYCCGGKKPLGQACARRGLDPSALMQELRQTGRSSTAADERDWTHATLTELADHIEQTHHAWLKRELPRLVALADKVNRVHGRNHSWLAELQTTVDAIAAEMQSHLFKEEHVLFPLIRRLEQGAGPGPMPVNGPISVMEHEHDHVAALLDKNRRLTNDFTPPADACNSFRTLLDGLRELETDTHRHIHKENNILFPRAQAAQLAVAGTSA